MSVAVRRPNPMDLDYRALSNAGTWCLGRLQTDADRARVLEGLGEDKKKSQLGALVKMLELRRTHGPEPRSRVSSDAWID